LKRSSVLLASFGLLCGLSAPSVLAESPARPTAAGKTPAPIRLRFSNTEFSDVIQALTLQTHASIVFPAGLKKLISVDVTATTTGQALSFITAAAGMAYRQIGRTYVVAAPADLRQALEPFGEKALISLKTLAPAEAVKMLDSALPYLTVRQAGNQVLAIGSEEDVAQARALLSAQDETRAADIAATDVVVLKYATASQVASLLKNMYPGMKAEAVGAADKPGGVVGLAGLKSQTESAKEAIRTLDVPAAARTPDRVYRVYPIKYGSAPILKDFIEKSGLDVVAVMGPEVYAPLAPNFRPLSGATLGTNSNGGTTSNGMGGSMGTGTTGGTAAASTQADGSRAKVIVLNGTPAELDKAFALLAEVDIPPQQVMVEVKVVDTSPERAEELGLKWSWTPFSFFEAPNGTNVSSAQNQVRPLGFGAISRVPWSFQSVLSAMVTNKEAKILADPRIQVVDNEDANIFIGETIRTQVSQSSIAGTTIQVLEFPVGIILLVRPRINSDGKITMRVHPVVSTVTDISSNNIPQTNSREAETTVMVQDGETVVIGGLIRDELSKTVTEVPLLSKLPLIGELFRHRSTSRRHSEIMVFITPHIVK